MAKDQIIKAEGFTILQCDKKKKVCVLNPGISGSEKTVKNVDFIRLSEIRGKDTSIVRFDDKTLDTLEVSAKFCRVTSGGDPGSNIIFCGDKRAHLK